MTMNSRPSTVASKRKIVMEPRRSSATLSTFNRDTVVKIKLRENGIIDLAVRRHGKLVQHRELGPQVNYDD